MRVRRPAIGEWTKMLISEHLRNCVTFLYAQRKTQSGGLEKYPVGTVFFVGMRVQVGPGYAPIDDVYAVTARHVIDGYPELWMRMRNPDGGFRDVAVPKGAWAQHSSTDVAVAALHEPRGVTFILTDLFVTQGWSTTHEIAEGEEVFFSGLFVGHYGRGVPQPIIRFGNIALMPREPVKVEISKHPKTWAEVDAYLVEARSWGGQSGSPAFAKFHSGRRGELAAPGLPPIGLLGLVQGTWKDHRGMVAPDPSGEGMVEINMGISVVIPAEKILEVIVNDEDFIAHRERLIEEGRSSAGSEMPPTGTSVDDDEFPQFEVLTRRLLKVSKKDLDDKLKDS